MIATTVRDVVTTPPLDARPLFHWADYLVFSISLGIPLAIGFFFMFYKRKEATTESFLVGERSMNYVAVSLSLLASLLNGAFVIGVPAEVHYYGIAISYVTFGVLVALVISAHVFVPKYHSMVLTSAYEYIERRYNKATRLLASSVFIVSVVVFLAIVLYVPALSFSQVTDLSLYVTIIITGVICTVYTAIGGMKAVVYTDALQMVILLVGLVIMAILGAHEAGGGQRVWQLAVDNQRTNFNAFSPDPRTRMTLWTQLFGQGVVYLGVFISNQMMVQRYMGVATARQAQAALYIVFVFFLPLVILVTFIGLVVHASYASCDPVFLKLIKTPDQIFPLYVMDLLGKYHGIPGLITASIFAAALSSVSSVINSLSAVCLEDFIDPAVLRFRKKPLEDRTRRFIAVGVVIFFGALTVGLSFAADHLTDKVIQASGTIWGVLGGPLAGIFVLGFLVPCTNSCGAIVGMISGLVIALWVSVGNIVYGAKTDSLPLFNCINNITMIIPIKNPNQTVTPVPLQDLYDVSFGWYGVIGTGVCMIVGFLVSIATGGCSKRYLSNHDPAMLYSTADNCCCCCPAACIRCYRCRVREYDETEVVKQEVNGHVGNGQQVAGSKLTAANGVHKRQNNYLPETGTDGRFRWTTIDGDTKHPASTNHNGAQFHVTFDNGHWNSGYMADSEVKF